MDRDHKLNLFESELLRWNRKMNLLGPAAKNQLAEHVEEAIEAARHLAPRGTVLDLGSGNGIPAVPLAIEFPEIQVHMVEADQRKWAFLKHIVRRCGLKAEVHGERLERLLGEGRLDDSIELLVSRAVAAPEQWLPPARRLLKENGRVGLFRTGSELPPIEGYERVGTRQLERGESNYLIELRKI